MLILSNIFIGMGLLFLSCGMIGMLRFRGFYRRLLYASLIDTVGMITLLLGLAFRQDHVAVVLKMGFLILCIFLTSPIISHKLGRSAYMSNHREEVKEYDH